MVAADIERMMVQFLCDGLALLQINVAFMSVLAAVVLVLSNGTRLRYWFYVGTCLSLLGVHAYWLFGRPDVRMDSTAVVLYVGCVAGGLPLCGAPLLVESVDLIRILKCLRTDRSKRKALVLLTVTCVTGFVTGATAARLSLFPLAGSLRAICGE